MELDLRPVTSTKGLLDLAFNHGSLALVFRLRGIRRLLCRGRVEEAADRAEAIVRRSGGQRAAEPRWLRLHTAELLARLGGVDPAIHMVLEETDAMVEEGLALRARRLLEDILAADPEHPKARRQLARLP
jgi:hypothetical protein